MQIRVKQGNLLERGVEELLPLSQLLSGCRALFVCQGGILGFGIESLISRIKAIHERDDLLAAH